MKQRIIGAALSLSVLCQFTAGAGFELPVRAAEVQCAGISFEAFAAQVQETVRGDADKALYQEILYDPENGTLSVDGEAGGTQAGELSVRGGTLMLDTGKKSGGSGISVQQSSRYLPFDSSGADYGYQSEQRGGLQVITNDFQTARLIVKAAGSIDRHGAVSAVEGWNDLHILQYADSAAAYAAYQCYLGDSGVQYVQPSRRIVLDTQASDAALTGLDTGNYHTWGADLIGAADFAGTYLDAEVLPEVRVAVIDTGINASPSIFSGRIIDGGINVSDSGDDTVNDDLYHGTHVSGTICELTPPNVKILPVKVFDADGTASDEQIYLGLMFALEQEADILNMSFGGLGVSPLEVEAMTIADEHGIICCAAAGNSGDLAEYYYPGGIESCITVGAVDSALERAPFSNNGALVDVMAPGVGISSYVLGNEEQLEAKNGTSMATPHVTACCALLKSCDRDLTPARAEALLRRNAVDLGRPGFDSDYAWGLVCLKDFQWDDGICYAPEFSRKSGNFGQPQTVSLSSLTPDSEIYYTTDGSVPTVQNGIHYTEPVVITETTYLRAICTKEGFADSVPSEAVYMIGGLDTADAWDIENGVLRRYTGVRSSVQLPAPPDGIPVTKVAQGAFSGNHFVRQVTLPDTVTEIGAEAFADCAALEAVTAKHASVIGERAFADDKLLQTLTLSETLTSIGAGACGGCAALKEIQLTGITEIPADCFSGCASLETVEMPDAAVFGQNAFSGCTSMRSASCRWERVKAIGKRAFADCQSWRGDLRLAALETVGPAAFSGASSLMRVTLPETVTALPDDLLRGCSGLRLLQLPGVTSLGSRALALGTSRADLTAELAYDRITEVGNNAFSGMQLGGSYDTISFDALETLSARSFGGVRAGALKLPKIKNVPAGEFTDAAVGLVYLEQAQTFEPNCVSGCSAVVLSDNAADIAEQAFQDGLWIVTLDTLPLDYDRLNLCAEPLVLGLNAQELSAEQYTQVPLYVLAGGVGMTYQWYTVSGDTLTALDGETAAVLYADSEKTGRTLYRCIMTDAGGKTEQTDYSVEITAAETVRETLTADTAHYFNDAALHRFSFTVPENGMRYLRITGAVPVQAELTDAAGRLLSAAQTRIDGSSVLTAELSAGETYYLDAAARWSGAFEMLLTPQTAAVQDIAACTVSATLPETLAFGTSAAPKVTVTAPDGTVLTQDTDYTVQVHDHNQNRIISVFGKGRMSGYTELTVVSYTDMLSDMPVRVSLSDDLDRAVFRFIPAVSGKYYYYATYAPGYAAEQLAFNRTGRYAGGSRYVSISTVGTVADTPDGQHTVYSTSNFNSATGTYFGDTVELNAGQPYYIICTAESAAEYQLMVAPQRYDIRDAEVEGVYFGSYSDGTPYFPEVTVTLNGEELTEGVDFERFHTNCDVPGKGVISVVGLGKYIGRIDKECDITLYGNVRMKMTAIGLDSPVQVTGAEKRIECLSFTVDENETEDGTTRYRILNERLSGGKYLFRLYRFDPVSRIYARINRCDSETNDYMLRNGSYRILCFRQYAEQTGSARFTLIKPYNLEEVNVEIGTVPYTGAETQAPIRVTAPDGTVLTEPHDFRIFYLGSHTLYGTTEFALRATNYSYGMRVESYETELILPEDSPELTPGEHSVYLTYDDRLAVYRVSAETDTEFSLSTADVPDIVLRAFTPEGELLDQDYGNSTKSVTFTVPGGGFCYVMVKFNGTARMGTISFTLDTEQRLLNRCEIVTEPHFYTGERVLPAVTFKDGDYVLEEGKDYRLRYTADDVNIGTATANFIGMGDYFGLCDVKYDIVAPDILHVEGADVRPMQIGYSDAKTEMKDADYLIFTYQAGTDMTLDLTLAQNYCTLTVQRYDGDGTYCGSIYSPESKTMRFEIRAGETCRFLCSATNITSWNRAFRLRLEDSEIMSYEIRTDAANGVTYRYNPETGYAEVYELDRTVRKLRLLPALPGTEIPVTFAPEALFCELPADTVVYGYPGCPAAHYADKYHFSYIELRAGQDPETAEPQTAGDLNADGRCTEADLVLLLRMMTEIRAMELSDAQIKAADCSGDGMIGFDDYMILCTMTEE